MFRPMRRKRQELSREACLAILARGTSGVLAVQGDGDYPYAVPLNYLLAGEKLYFHCAKEGHKLDAIARQDKVSFCVVDLEENVPEKFTTYFRSVVVFGRATVVTDEAEMREAVDALARRFAPNEPTERRLAEIEREWRALAVIRLDMEHLSGKQAIELVEKK